MKRLVFIGISIIILIVLFFALSYKRVEAPGAVINSFEECAKAKYPILESYPRQCKIPDGKTFIEDIGNELEKQDFIRVNSPRPNALINSPVKIKGEARGYWFFEADFPIKLYDENDNLLGIAIAQAKGDWMTENFVPFGAILEFETPTTQKGVLVFEKDNPSGLSEHYDELRMPIYFK